MRDKRINSTRNFCQKCTHSIIQFKTCSNTVFMQTNAFVTITHHERIDVTAPVQHYCSECLRYSTIRRMNYINYY